MSQTTPTADFAGFEASDAELQAVIGPVPPGADSDGRSTSIDYMQPIPGSEQSNLGAFLADPDQVVRTHNYGQPAPDDAPLLVGGSGVDYGPRIGFIDYFKIIGGGIASFIPEGVRDFEYSRIVSESARLSSVDNPEYDGIADYSAGNGKGWTLSLPTYDDVKAGLGKAYNALAATFGEGQNTRDVTGLEYKDIDSYPEDVGSGWRLSVPTGGELVDFANAMYGRTLSLSNAYSDAIEQGNYYRAGLALGSDPMVQGMGLMVGTFGLTKPLSASGRLAPEVQLNSYGDHLRDVLGPGRVSHPDEYASILDAAKERGVNVVDRPGTLAYEPALSQGNPGRLLLDPDASIGAMRHEYRHLLDDQASGYQGFRLMMDSDNFWKLEFRGYMEEINLARELREFDTGRKILQEMRARRQEILGR
ncbi:MAG: hypothetical protein AB2652_20705 [Candidatus Thiodiazotropha endolucinida]